MNLVKTFAALTMTAATFATTLTAAEAHFRMPQRAVASARVAAMPQRAITSFRFAMPRQSPVFASLRQNTVAPFRQNLAFASLRQNTLGTHPFNGFRLGSSRFAAVNGTGGHQPTGGAPTGAKPDFDIGGALNGLNNAINTATDIIADVVERLDTDPGPTCGWAVCSDGSRP